MKLYYCMYLVGNEEKEIWVLSSCYRKAYQLAVKALQNVKGIDSLMVKEADNNGR